MLFRQRYTTDPKVVLPLTIQKKNMKRRSFLKSSTGTLTLASTLGFTLLSNQLMANAYKTDASGKAICDSLWDDSGPATYSPDRKRAFQALRLSGTLSCDDAVDQVGGAFKWTDHNNVEQTAPALLGPKIGQLKDNCCA